MKFKHIRTGAILEPHSDFVLEQFQKSPDLIPFDDPEPVAAATSPCRSSRRTNFWKWPRKPESRSLTA